MTFVGELERKRPLRRLENRWVDNIEINLGYTEWGGMDWINLGQDKDRWKALVNTVMNFWVP
jgi:hypothetical protein